MSVHQQPEVSPWGHLVLMAVFVIATVAFLYDTLSQSFRLENVIVILPVSGLVLLLCLKQIYRTVRSWPVSSSEMQSDSSHPTAETGVSDQTQTEGAEPVATGSKLGATTKALILMGLLGLYVLGLTYFYFDVSTVLFIWLTLLAQGERRLVFGAIYALAISWFVVWGLKQMVSFPFDTLMF